MIEIGVKFSVKYREGCGHFIPLVRGRKNLWYTFDEI
jgi:hypothetical protein